MALKKPDYIEFLLSPTIQDQLGFHVNVGTPDSEVERIGCLRWMLIARSKVLRTMLLESELKVGKEMDITDLKPNTFKNFLTYVYGHDHTSSLKFEECIDLLGAAEKYDMDDLKNRLASLVTSMVSAQNVCTVLKHGPVCETVPELWEKTTEIIQSKTDVVFALPQFLTLSPSAVVHILQQDALSVMEIDVWRAALNWAKAQLDGSSDSGMMRDVMLPLLKHTRICTFTNDQLCKEVVPANVITIDEFKQICAVINNKKEEQTDLATVCNIVQPRRQYNPPWTFSDTVTCQLGDYSNSSSWGSVYLIKTGSFDVKLESISLKPTGSRCRYQGSISVMKLDNDTDDDEEERNTNDDDEERNTDDDYEERNTDDGLYLWFTGDDDEERNTDDDDEEHRFLANIGFNQNVPRNEKCQITMQSVDLKAGTKYQLKLVFKSAIHGLSSFHGTLLLSKDELRVHVANEMSYVPVISHLSEVSYQVAC